MAQQIGPSFATLHIPTRFIVSDMTVHTEETNTFSAPPPQGSQFTVQPSMLSEGVIKKAVI